MSFSIESKDLKPIIDAVSKAIDPLSSKKLHKSFFFEVKDKYLKIAGQSATQYIEVTTVVSADAEDTAFCIPIAKAQALCDRISTLTFDLTELTGFDVDNDEVQVLTVISKDAVSESPRQIRVYPADDWEQPRKVKGSQIKVSSSTLATYLGAIQFATTKDAAMQPYNGVNFASSPEEGTLYLTAADKKSDDSAAYTPIAIAGKLEEVDFTLSEANISTLLALSKLVSVDTDIKFTVSPDNLLAELAAPKYVVLYRCYHNSRLPYNRQAVTNSFTVTTSDSHAVNIDLTRFKQTLRDVRTLNPRKFTLILEPTNSIVYATSEEKEVIQIPLMRRFVSLDGGKVTLSPSKVVGIEQGEQIALQLSTDRIGEAIDAFLGQKIMSANIYFNVNSKQVMIEGGGHVFFYTKDVRYDNRINVTASTSDVVDYVTTITTVEDGEEVDKEVSVRGRFVDEFIVFSADDRIFTVEYMPSSFRIPYSYKTIEEAIAVATALAKSGAFAPDMSADDPKAIAKIKAALKSLSVTPIPAASKDEDDDDVTQPDEDEDNKETEDNEDDEEATSVAPPAKRRGRKPKATEPPATPEPDQKKPRRGRPPANKAVEPSAEPKKRGRPKGSTTTKDADTKPAKISANK